MEDKVSDLRDLRPAIGIGVYIFNHKGQVLLGKRKGSHASGLFSSPGGHLEFAQSFEEAVRKEVEEETGLKVRNPKIFFVDNNLGYIKEGKHYITLSFKTSDFEGEPQVLEPEKCEFWNWYSLDELPTPLTEWTERALKHLKD